MVRYVRALQAAFMLAIAVGSFLAGFNFRHEWERSQGQYSSPGEFVHTMSAEDSFNNSLYMHYFDVAQVKDDNLINNSVLDKPAIIDTKKEISLSNLLQEQVQAAEQQNPQSNLLPQQLGQADAAAAQQNNVIIGAQQQLLSAQQQLELQQQQQQEALIAAQQIEQQRKLQEQQLQQIQQLQQQLQQLNQMPQVQQNVLQQQPLINPPKFEQNVQQQVDQQQQPMPQPMTGGVPGLGIMVYDVKGDIADQYECIWMNNNPSAPVCLYNEVVDNVISRQLKATSTWEPDNIKLVQNALQRNPQMGFLDIGTNIGVYTLTVAMMNRKVISIEPGEQNLKRLHKAIKMAHVEDNVTVLKNIISDKAEMMILQPSEDNQGDLRAVSPTLDMQVACGAGAACNYVSSITLDDLVPLITFPAAVMKMDIQGYEHRAFQKASKLFDAINIPYVFVEWILMQEFYVSPQHVSEDKRLVEEMINFFKLRNYRVLPVQPSAYPDLTDIPWNMWTYDVLFVHQLML